MKIGEGNFILLEGSADVRPMTTVEDHKEELQELFRHELDRPLAFIDATFTCCTEDIHLLHQEHVFRA